MKIANLMDVISAGHASRYVKSPFEQRGAMALCGPPGHCKSTIIESSLLPYPDVLLLGDINITELGRLKDSLIGGRYSTLAFGEMEKLYERNPATAANLEGHFRAMVEEGFDKMSFQPSQMASMKARIFMVVGITPSAYARRYQHWLETGFARRFLWFVYRLENPDVIIQAIHKWERLKFGSFSTKIPANREIPYHVPSDVNNKLLDMLRDQPAKETPFVLLKKVYCTLEFRYGRKKAEAILDDVAPALSKNGDLLYI